ncbi:carbonic anhydrase 15-like [Neophocaena asiaeorientalis asiaeorientalis]|uniref:Carbonic anhydrase 15-like n=1 Tax=Neophocaena asiaeorientalis asiaeorientalis TaxID=1706337 RepID=A0A341CXY4_NEOAA|nr:carbonic anhydrase 15-like [Neophocaena asiaeorientalis asiaeorientalis]
MTQHLQACGRWRIMVIQMHVVHMNTRYQSIGEARGHPDGLAVLALLLTDQDSDNARLSVRPEERVCARGEGRGSPRRGRGDRTPGDWFQPAAVSPRGLREPGVHLPAGLSRFYRYAGSLTTRCCEPVVLWTVFEDTVPIGSAQVRPDPGNTPGRWAVESDVG